jgi:hypothetical protein
MRNSFFRVHLFIHLSCKLQYCIKREQKQEQNYDLHTLITDLPQRQVYCNHPDFIDNISNRCCIKDSTCSFTYRVICLSLAYDSRTPEITGNLINMLPFLLLIVFL